MFYKYEVINNGKEDILYLYLDTKYEFSRELVNSGNISDLSRRTRNFINSNKINFKGKKVYLIVDGIVVKTLNILDLDNNTNIQDNFTPDNYMIILLLEDNSKCEISFRNYLLSVLLDNIDMNLNDEVIKSVVILYNGYIFKQMKENGYIDINNSFMKYKDLEILKKTLINSNNILSRLNKILDNVFGLFLSYNHDYILPFIHYSNGGKTFSSPSYPYLSSVKSLWDLMSPYFVSFKTFTFSEFSKKLNIKINTIESIKIYHDDNCKQILFHNVKFTADEFKNLLNLNSNNFYVILYSNYLKIITIGMGNGYGLSLFAANELANNGSKCYDILKYFFPKANLFKYTKKLS